MNILIHVLLVLAIGGFLVWAILQVPKPAPFNNLILGIAVIAAVLYVLSLFGFGTGIHFHV